MTEQFVSTVAQQLADLSKPFEFGEHKIRVMQRNKAKDKGIAAVYIDARAVMDRLDDAVGNDHWTTLYTVLVSEAAYWAVECSIMVTLADGRTIKHTDVGEGTKSENEINAGMTAAKDAYSDSIKRAAVHLGVGRYLYGLDIVGGYYLPITDYGSFTPESIARLEHDLNEKLALLNGGQPIPKSAPPPASTHTAQPKHEEVAMMTPEAVREMPFGPQQEALAGLYRSMGGPAGDYGGKLWTELVEAHSSSRGGKFGDSLTPKQAVLLGDLLNKRYTEYGDDFANALLTAICGEIVGTREGDRLPGWKTKNMIEWLIKDQTDHLEALDDIAIQVASFLSNGDDSDMATEEIPF